MSGWLIPLEWWPYKCYGSYYNASVACLALELRAGPWVLQCGMSELVSVRVQRIVSTAGTAPECVGKLCLDDQILFATRAPTMKFITSTEHLNVCVCNSQ